MNLLKKTIQGIAGPDPAVMARARAYQDRLTKPLGSLGRLEELAIKICGIAGRVHPKVKCKRVVVFAGDHGVVSEGVSAYPKEVTAQMVYNFLNEGAGINAIARAVSAEFEVVDIGVDHEFSPQKGLVRKKVARGTKNFCAGPAMTKKQAVQALEIGIERAFFADRNDVNLIAGGDMGIGNTTSASALFCAYLGIKPEKIVGPGTGLDPKGIRHKAEVVEKALDLHCAAFPDPLETLAALGGFEIAGLAGLYLGACERRMAVLVDGFIATAAALAAIRLCPIVSELLFFSHLSEEPGHKLVLEKMGARPLLSLDLRLGEGTGACLAMPLVESALSCHNRMASFQSAGVSEKEA
jgi:nicotinate-nucleotide--dimethylbenzimidazole phosphoribosyltransferase